MLSEEQVKNMKACVNFAFSTVGKNGMPRTIIVQPSRIEKDKIILSSIQMQKSFDNLKLNKNVFINCYFPELEDLQYKIEGKAEVQTSGALFDEIKTFEESENLPPELKVNAIIIVKITSIEESLG